MLAAECLSEAFISWHKHVCHRLEMQLQAVQRQLEISKQAYMRFLKRQPDPRVSIDPNAVHSS